MLCQESNLCKWEDWPACRSLQMQSTQTQRDVILLSEKTAITLTLQI